MKKLLTVSIFAALFAFVSACAAFAADDVIGVVEYERVLANHPKMQQVQNQMKSASDKKEQEAKTAINKESSEEKKAQIFYTKRNELVKEEQGLMMPLLKDVDLAIRKAAQAKKVTVVVEKNATFTGGTDLTADAIAALKK